MYKIFFMLLFLFSFLEARIDVVVTLPVHEKIIEKIAKNEIVVHVINSDIKNFEDLSYRAQNNFIFSSVYFTFGLDEEKKYIELFKSKNKYIEIIDATKGIKKDMVNGKLNPYVWMDPLLLRKVAINIYNKLVNLASYKKSFFKENLDNYLDELDEVFLALKKKLDGSDYYNIYVYKPYWHYYAKRFALNLFYKPTRALMAEELKDSIEEARKNHIKKVLISKNNALYSIANSLANQIDGEVIENDISEFNWRTNIFSLSRKISGN